MGCGATRDVHQELVIGDKVEVQDSGVWILGEVVGKKRNGQCLVWADGWKSGPYAWSTIAKVPAVVSSAPLRKPLRSSIAQAEGEKLAKRVHMSMAIRKFSYRTFSEGALSPRDSSAASLASRSTPDMAWLPPQSAYP
ncbi:hypothetical protein DIPPA_22232 [Diplonema papillatum]|nr:hypothetical protein DIPPA_22232 [Diplonema papillatum]